MKLKDYPQLVGYKLVCHDCGSKRLRAHDPFRNWFTEEPRLLPNHLILECLDCFIDIYPEEDLEKELELE